jgi:hypothetical protein
MNFSYTLWTNVSSGFRRIYQPGDSLVRGFAGVVDAESIADASALLFARHNRDDRPDGQIAPSMSVGDVIEFSECALSVADIGFAVVVIADRDRVTDRSWLEVVDQA